MLGQRELEPQWYEGWRQRYQTASTAIDQRAEKVAKVAEELERELVLVGATAIEDKLQEGVPETIANLAEAGIKIWVLTGDKKDTAINIGFSCRLLQPEYRLIVVRETMEALSLLFILSSGGRGRLDHDPETAEGCAGPIRQRAQQTRCLCAGDRR